MRKTLRLKMKAAGIGHNKSPKSSAPRLTQVERLYQQGLLEMECVEVWFALGRAQYERNHNTRADRIAADEVYQKGQFLLDACIKRVPMHQDGILVPVWEDLLSEAYFAVQNEGFTGRQIKRQSKSYGFYADEGFAHGVGLIQALSAFLVKANHETNHYWNKRNK